MRLLVVDDSPAIRVLVREITGEQAHEIVAEAENGRQALESYRETLPEMVLLDISMPVMGGFAAARELRRISPEIPIIFISQHSEAEYVTAAFELGARGYVLKTAIPSELNQAIDTLKNGRQYRSSQLANARPEENDLERNV